MSSITDQYLTFLKGVTTVHEPRGVVFHDFYSTTKVFSGHPLPAWTSDELIHVDPIVLDWKRIFLSAVSENTPNEIRSEVESYYSTLDLQDMATIVGHEITHHPAVFSPTWDHEINDATWFEEGMCLYLPRKKLLSAERFEALMRVEELLIQQHKQQFGGRPVWQFGASDDGSGFVAALFDYWRAVSIVRRIVEDHASGDALKVLQLFEYWVEHAGTEQHFFYFVTEHLNIPKANTLEY